MDQGDKVLDFTVNGTLGLAMISTNKNFHDTTSDIAPPYSLMVC